MPDYNLFGLDPRTFQQLCQSLVLSELGPGVVVFGDGPDGGRDAAFKGKVNYPSDVDQWNGSIIVQVKFRQQRIEDTRVAGRWVTKQLKADLDTFKPTRRKGSGGPGKREAPDYYLLVTNISLTPYPHTGTDAQVRQLLGTYARKLGLKGYDVWDGEKIKRLLDSHRDIAISYAGYVTTGDVLTQMHKYLQDIRADFTTVMADFVQSEFTGPEQYARLTEAGSTAQRRSLASVFVDLPVVDQLSGNPADEKCDDLEGVPPGFLAEVLEVAGLRFDRASVLDRRKEGASDDSEDQPTNDGRIVLIGGPGQGKSTLGQFLCQLFRAALLQDWEKSRITDDAEHVLGLILKWCERDNVAVPNARRFPVRIELKAFADALAAEACDSLLEYTAQRIDKRSGGRVDRNDLDKWLCAYPWLLVLDGLDEVPAAGNRGQVLDEIQQFNSQCATRGADVLIVATSRPQGYGDAFGAKSYWHRYLAPLSTSRAVCYAKRLVELCHADDEEKQEEILGRLQKASKHANTQRLMRSPLQVTILAVLAELQGELPDDRWELFQEYYQTIYKRETQRNQALSPVLKTYRVEIDQAHERVGLNLQVLNEASGRNDAFLSREEFALLLRGCLADRFGDDGAELDSVAEQIETAALERLVFLVSPKGEDVGFEIRSLQEFMAARALTDGTDEQICKRMTAIAPYPFWRNVFMFSAGRCVRDRRHLIETVIGICATLNNTPEEPACVNTMAGSSLALDLLEDATFHRSHRHSLCLMESAFQLLGAPSEELHRRLAAVCVRSSESPEIIGRRLQDAIGSGNVAEGVGGWRVLLELVELGEQWAENLADRLWPAEVDEQLKALETMPFWDEASSLWIVDKKIGVAPRVPPSTLAEGVAEAARPPWLIAYDRIRQRSRVDGRITLRLDKTAEPSLWLRFVRIPEYGNEWRQLREMPDLTGSWEEVAAAARFVEDPSKESLSAELAMLAQRDMNGGNEPNRWSTYMVPWPLALCLRAANGGRGLRDLSDAALEGEFGDHIEWMEIQDRWMRRGIDLGELEHVVRCDEADVPLEARWVDFCSSCEWIEGWQGDISEDIYRLIELREKMPSAARRDVLGSLLVRVCMAARRTSHISLDGVDGARILKAWPKERGPYAIPLFLAESVVWPSPMTPEIIDGLEEIGRKSRSMFYMRRRRIRLEEEDNSARFVSDLIDAYIDDYSRKGLLRWIAGLAMAVEDEKRIPKQLLWPNGSEDRDVCGDLLSLLLFWGELSVDDAEYLSKIGTAMWRSGEPRWSRNPSLRMMSHHWEEPWALKFILHTMRDLPDDEEWKRGECHSWLENYLARRLSPLHSAKVAEELGLAGLK